MKCIYLYLVIDKRRFISCTNILCLTFSLLFDFEMYRRKDTYIYKSSLISGIKYTRTVISIIERKKKIFWGGISYYYCKNFRSSYEVKKWLIVPEIKKWFMFMRSGWMLTIPINHWSNIKSSLTVKFCVSSKIYLPFFFFLFFNYARSSLCHMLRI